MCLAIPGRVIEFVDADNHIAKVDVGGVRRNVNTAMLEGEGVQVGDYVLIHVGFAMSKIDEREAEETLRLLKEIGEYETEIDQFKGSLE